MSKNISSNTPPNILFFSKKCKTCNLFITMCQQNKILKYFQMIDVDDKIKELSEKGLKVVPTIIIKGLSKPIEGKIVFTWLESIISMNTNKRIDTSGDQYLPETEIYQVNQVNQGNQGNQVNQVNQVNQGNQVNQVNQGNQVNQVRQLNQVQSNPISNPISGAGTINSNNNIVKRNIVAPPPIIGIKQDNQDKNVINKTPAIKMVNGVEVKNNNGPSVKSQPFGFLQDEMAGFSDSFAYLMSDNALPKAFLPYDKDLQIYTAPEGDALDKKQQDLLMKNIEMIRDNDKSSFIKSMETEHQKILVAESNNKKK